MTELDIYSTFKSVIAAMEATEHVPYVANCYVVGYVDDLQSENIDKPAGSLYSFSRKATADSFQVDYPLVLMWPLTLPITSLRSGPVTEEYNATILVLDLFRNDRDNDNTSDAAAREEEVVWAHCLAYTKAMLKAVNDTRQMMIITPVSTQKVSQFGNNKLSGIRADFKIRIQADC